MAVPKTLYTPKYSFKKVINLAWNAEEYGYDPIDIDKVVAITAASMIKELSKIAPEKWYTRLGTELKPFMKENRRNINKMTEEEIENLIENEWVKGKHLTEKRALISSSPLYTNFDEDKVILEPEVADNFRKNILLPGEKPVDLETFKPSKQTIEKHQRAEQIQKEREELLQAVLEGRTSF